MTAGGDTLVGTDLAGYRVAELIGRGGMGEVYRARDLALDRPVALKVLADRYAADPALREQILRESRLAAATDHPNIVPIYEAGEADGRVFIAMRFVDGESLQVLRRRVGALEPAQAIAILAQVADALDAAHARGLVHRDVKPSNCLLDAGGNCYLADFGLTQAPAEREHVTDGRLMGTVDYVAPEQIRGDEVDLRADVYALGCVLLECLTGEPPFHRVSDLATLFAHLEEEPPRASERQRSLPRAVDDVLAKAMARDPDARYGSCGELVAAAREALGLAAPPRLSRRAVLAAGGVAVALAGAAVAAALLLAGGGGGPAAATGTLVRVDPGRDRVAATYPVSAHPGVVTTSAGRVWLGDFREGALYRLQPSTGEITRVSSTGEPRDLTSLGGVVYVASDSASLLTGTVTAYDAVTGVRRGGLDLLTCSLAGGEGVLWVAGCPFVERVSDTGGRLRVVRRLKLPLPSLRTGESERVSLHDMAVGFGSVWVTGDMLDRRLWRLDRHTGRILATIQLPLAPRTLAAGAGAIWITAPIDDAVLRLDPATNRVTDRIPVGRGARGLAAGFGSVWVANALDGSVSRIDPARRAVAATIRVRGLPHEVAAGAGGVWVSVDAR